MYDFILPKKTGLAISVVLLVISLVIYGCDYQGFGYNKPLVPGLALLTFVLALIHYSRPPDSRRSHDAETLGWQVMALLLAAIYLARDIWIIDPKIVKHCVTGIFALQVVNYVGCKMHMNAAKK